MRSGGTRLALIALLSQKAFVGIEPLTELGRDARNEKQKNTKRFQSIYYFRAEVVRESSSNGFL